MKDVHRKCLTEQRNWTSDVELACVTSDIEKAYPGNLSMPCCLLHNTGSNSSVAHH